MIYEVVLRQHTGPTTNRNTFQAFVESDTISGIIEKVTPYLNEYKVEAVKATDYDVINLKHETHVNDYIAIIGVNTTKTDEGGATQYDNKEVHVIAYDSIEALNAVKMHLGMGDILIGLEMYNEDVDFID